MVPHDRLAAARIKPEGKAIDELASGEPVEYEYGFARMRFMGTETIAQVIFEPEDAEPILSVVAEHRHHGGPDQQNFKAITREAAQVTRTHN